MKMYRQETGGSGFAILAAMVAVFYLSGCTVAFSAYPVTSAEERQSYDSKEVRCLWGDCRGSK